MKKLEQKENKKIKVIGLGGSGCSIVHYLESNYRFNDNVKIIGSDSAICGMKFCKNKLPLARVYPMFLKVRNILENDSKQLNDIMCCIGCNGNTTLGEYSAFCKYDEIKNELEGVDILILTTVLGGGTGSGAIKRFVMIAQELGINVYCIVSKPCSFFGKKYKDIAEESISELLKINGEVIECDIFDEKLKTIPKYLESGNINMSKKIVETFLNEYIIND